MSAFNIGDKVSQVPNNFSEPFSKGTIVDVHLNDINVPTYDILWEGFDWITVGWNHEELVPISK